jgi:putative toxin-antitoxin system antitoxin component (TIGR02293 family)
MNYAYCLYALTNHIQMMLQLIPKNLRFRSNSTILWTNVHVMKPSSADRQISSELISLLRQSDLHAQHKLPHALGLSDFFNTRIYPVYIIKNGIPYSVFEVISSLSPFSMQDWSEFLNMSYKSLQRHKTSNSPFKPAHSERILELTEVMSMGEEVFDDTRKFRHWLHTKNYALGNLTPMELLSSSYGKELVLSELVRVDEGIFV